MALTNADKIEYLLSQIHESEKILYRNEVDKEMFISFPTEAKKLKKSGDMLLANIAEQVEEGFERRVKEGLGVDIQVQAAVNNCTKLLSKFDKAEIEKVKAKSKTE